MHFPCRVARYVLVRITNLLELRPSSFVIVVRYGSEPVALSESDISVYISADSGTKVAQDY